MKARARVVVALAVAAGTLVTGHAASSAATDLDRSLSVALSLGYPGHMLVDWDRGQVFLTDAIAGGVPLVISTRGDEITHLNDYPDAAGLTLAGSAIWVALPAESRIAKLDTVSYAEVASIGFVDGTCPQRLAETLGKLIIAEGCHPDDHNLIVHDLATATATRLSEEMLGPIPATSKGAPGLVAVGGNVDTMYVLDVSGPTPVIQTSRPDLSDHNDVVFSPSGDRILFVSQHPESRSPSDLSLQVIYDNDRTISAAFDPTSEHVATGSDIQEAVTVRLHEAATADVIREYQTGFGDDAMALAFSPDGRWIVSVGWDSNDRVAFWHVLPGLGWPKCNGRGPTVVGSNGPDRIRPPEGSVVLGRGGDDVIKVYGDDNHVCGGYGDDVIDGSVGRDFLHGGKGNDSIDGLGRRDRMFGGLGTDTLRFDAHARISVDLTAGTANTGKWVDVIGGFEIVTGTPGNDTLIGNDADNTLVGRGGRDIIDGGRGADTLKGDGGADVLLGFTGPDTLLGGKGADLLAGEGGADTVDGGLGRDTVSFANATRQMVVDLAAGTASGEGPDVLASIEWVIGSAYRDTIVGNAKANYLNGAAGRDEIRGQAGDDYLVGGIGTDSLFGGAGNDSCVAGEVLDSCELTADLWSGMLGLYNEHAVETRAASLFWPIGATA